MSKNLGKPQLSSRNTLRTSGDRATTSRAANPPTITLTLATPALLRDRRVVLSLVLLLGLIVRLWAMHWPPFPIDMNDWIAWGERIRDVGPRRFYAPGVFADYAPGYIYVLWLTAIVKHTFFATSGADTYHALYRLPPLLCDLGSTALIFLTVERAWNGRLETDEGTTDARGHNLLMPALAALAFALNPAVIIDSAVWGQVDATFTFVLLLAVLLLPRKPEAAALSYVIAFLIKPQAFVLAPVFAIALIMRYPLIRVARIAVISVALAFIIIFPFFGFRSFFELLNTINKSTNTYAYTSLFTYNLWGIYGFWKSDTVPLLGGLTLKTFGYLLYAAGLVYGVAEMVQQLRRKTEFLYTVFLFASYFAFLPIIVLTRMHERYLYPILPFLLIFAFLSLRKMTRHDTSDFAPRFLVLPLLIYAAVTMLHTMNLYQVYEYYSYYNTGGVPKSNDLFYNVYNNASVWCVLILLTFTTFVLCIPYWLPPWLPHFSLRLPRTDIVGDDEYQRVVPRVEADGAS
ncbi:MAG: hypothetical protein ACR2PL_01165 [Dehalococcoidia bacterium]